ncbi:MAG: hypothetical protein ACM3JF_00950 [Sphaerimonospora mesophila]
MKKTDWAMVILIVAIVGVASYFVVGALLPSPGENPETVETATAISSDYKTPSEKNFSADAINPTVKVTIGNQGGEEPFTLGSN